MKGINMVPQVLASGDFVEVMPFIMIIAIVVIVFWFLINKKRLEHQQIMTAIEKGIPLSELRPVMKKGADWIISLTVGIAFLLMGIGMAIVSLIYFCGQASFGLLMPSIVFFAIGTAGIIRGILQRKADKASSSDNSALDANHGQ
jgi:ABC-type cobalamin transport system permease subunit